MCMNFCKLSLANRLFSHRTLENRTDTNSKSKTATRDTQAKSIKKQVPSTSNPTPSHHHTLRRETLLLPEEQKVEREPTPVWKWLPFLRSHTPPEAAGGLASGSLQPAS